MRNFDFWSCRCRRLLDVNGHKFCFAEKHWARSIRPKTAIRISDIFVCRIERYFLPGWTDLVLFPLDHISCQGFLDKILNDHAEAAVFSAVSCFMQRNLTRIHNYLSKLFRDIYLTDSKIIFVWREKLANFSRGRVWKPGQLTGPQEIRKFRS